MNKKRLGIGFIGGGFISRFHIQSLISVRDVDVFGVSQRQNNQLKKQPIWLMILVWVQPKHMIR